MCFPDPDAAVLDELSWWVLDIYGTYLLKKHLHRFEKRYMIFVIFGTPPHYLLFRPVKLRQKYKILQQNIQIKSKQAKILRSLC